MRDRSSLADPVLGPTNPLATADGVRRIGSVIALVPEREGIYRMLHADAWPGVLDRLSASNIRNYSIFIAEIGDRKYLFSYFEYVGQTFEADMSAIAADPVTRDWWAETDPCQQRLPGTPDGEQWLPLEPVFFAGLARQGENAP